jgi:hypothetical protein
VLVANEVELARAGRPNPFVFAAAAPVGVGPRAVAVEPIEGEADRSETLTDR